jgi:hypothetical protein
MASFTVLAIASFATLPFLITSYALAYPASRPPLRIFAYIFIFLSIGRLIYSVILYPIFFTPFKHLPAPPVSDSPAGSSGEIQITF